MKIAYLTIDDAPSKDFIRKLDFLSSKNIPAILFCEGRFLEERFDDGVCAIRKGYIVGNHGYDHKYF